MGLFLIWKVEASLESSSSKTPAILLFLASFSGELKQPVAESDSASAIQWVTRVANTWSEETVLNEVYEQV